MFEEGLHQIGGITLGIPWPFEPSLLDTGTNHAGGIGGRLDEFLGSCGESFQKIGCNGVEGKGGFVPASSLHVVHVVTENVKSQLFALQEFFRFHILTHDPGGFAGRELADQPQPMSVAQATGLGVLGQGDTFLTDQIGAQGMFPGSLVVDAIVLGGVLADALV